jgi:SAM-dependent methyltransferase
MFVFFSICDFAAFHRRQNECEQIRLRVMLSGATTKEPSLGLPADVQRIVVCPDCGSAIELSDAAAHCGQCAASYPITASGQVDLRLRRPKQVPVQLTIGSPNEAWHTLVEPIKPNPNPQIDYQAIPIPRLLSHGNRMTRELLSYFPKSRNGGMMLDFGCGNGEFREICSQTNMQYVGIDWSGPAPILADGHALPFRDESFDFILSFAVLEHLRHPIVALREMYRVLKAGSRLIGTSGFIEPFHLDSYQHLSPLALDCLLKTAGFKIEHLEANTTWTGLRALGWMSLFPHSPRWFGNFIVLPLELMHRAWWKIGHLIDRRIASSDAAREVNNAGGFRWVCCKA